MARAFFAAMLALAMLGCSPRADLRGTWLGFRDLPVEEGADAVIVRTLARVELRIDDRGRFELFESGLTKRGDMSYQGSSAELHVDEVAGARTTAEARITVELQEDGTLRYRHSANPAESVILQRQD
jgi:hypothetical protein